MWKLKKLKKSARSYIKTSYSRTISVCFLTAILTSAYPVSTTFLNLQTSSAANYTDAVFALGNSNSDIIIETVRNFLRSTPVFELFKGDLSCISSLAIDLYTTNFSVFFAALRTVNLFASEPFKAAFLFAAAGVILSFFYQIFIGNILIIGEKRFFLEIRKYPKTAVSKVFYLFKLRCLLNPAWVMLCRSFFQFLWNLTVIGGIIKHYEYSMIPFILAENPRASRKDVFYLSRQLMHKNKWKLFLLDLSFAGWQILSVFTFGLLGFLWVNPYTAACRGELYGILRKNYILARSPRYDVLSDAYLEHVPSEDELLISKALYNDSQGPYTAVTYFNPEQYPVFLFSVQPPRSAVRPVKTDQEYNVKTCIYLFHVFSFFGWVLELAVHLIREGSLTQTYAVIGPWIPLYGLYAVLVLRIIPRKVRKYPAAVFFINFIIYSVLEYTFNFVYETLNGGTLREYSHFLLNLNNRIYLGGSVSYALLGCAFLYYLAPRWAAPFQKQKKSRQLLICIVLSVLFAADVLFTAAVRHDLLLAVDF